MESFVEVMEMYHMFKETNEEMEILFGTPKEELDGFYNSLANEELINKIKQI